MFVFAKMFVSQVAVPAGFALFQALLLLLERLPRRSMVKSCDVSRGRPSGDFTARCFAFPFGESRAVYDEDMTSGGGHHAIGAAPSLVHAGAAR